MSTFSYQAPCHSLWHCFSKYLHIEILLFRVLCKTPIAYCLSRYSTYHVTVDGNDTGSYDELHLSIWIYKKEGMTFTKLKPYGKNESKAFTSGNLPDYVPLLAHFKGRRHFLGPRFPSFPDPSMKYFKKNTEEDQINNWHNTGYISANSAGTGLASSSQRVSLTPPSFYKDLDNRMEYTCCPLECIGAVCLHTNFVECRKNRE